MIRRLGMVLAIALATSLAGCRSAPDPRPAKGIPDPYLDAALRTADWLVWVSEDGSAGREWPVVPNLPESSGETEGDEDPTLAAPPPATLYHGNSGVVLFFLEAWRATGNDEYLELARQGADSLLARLPRGDVEPSGTGLYTGIAGIGFALEEVYEATDDPLYRTGTESCISMLDFHSRETGSGLEWNESTDVVDGTAGIGLFLLYAERRVPNTNALAMARRAGDRLLEQGIEGEGGLLWRMDPSFPRYMPNFSHGTAGVAYFLAALHERTGDRRYLAAATQGARHLLAIADTAEEGCKIYHHEPGGEELYYLGWCHGPPGTGRLFYQLYRITGNPLWLDWTERTAASILNSGIPEQETPGFWNNTGQCCGTAGVLEYLLDLHDATGKDVYLDAAKRFGDHLIASRSESAEGCFWELAEHRVRPDELTAQTGHMQGAAGIGRALLRLSGRIEGEYDGVCFPDSPFPR